MLKHAPFLTEQIFGPGTDKSIEIDADANLVYVKGSEFHSMDLSNLRRHFKHRFVKIYTEAPGRITLDLQMTSDY